MAGAFRIAEGYVEVTADESGYDRAIDRLKAKRTQVRIGVDLDDKSATAKLKALIKPLTVKLTADLDDKAATTALRRLTRDRTVRLTADLDSTAAAGALASLTRDRTARITAHVDSAAASAQLHFADRTVNILVDLEEAARRLAEAQLDALTRDRTVRVFADLDTRTAADDLALLTRQRTARITADADTRIAADDLALLTRPRTVNVRVDVDGSALRVLSGLGGAAGSAGMLSMRLLALAAAALSALPTVAALGSSIAQMGPAAAVAVPLLGGLVTAVATLAVGLSGVGAAFKAAGQSSGQSGASAVAAARAVAEAQINVARASRSLKEAQQDAARAISDAQKRVKAAAEDVRDAEVQAAADRQAALRRVADAERDLTDAIQDARQAQEDLTDARKEAAEQLEDLNSRLANAELDQRQAVLDVAEAEKALAAVKAKGAKATAEELAEAQLQYDRSVQRLKDQQTETERLREDTAAANAAGVEGSETVVSAQQKVADAQRNVGDRARDAQDAQAEAAQTAKDGAEAVRDAQERLAEAQQGVADAQVQAARQVRSAQESLADAHRAVAAAQEQGVEQTDKYAEAMAKLSPNAQSFVTAVRAMGPAFSSLKMDVQDRLFRGLDDSVTRLGTAALPAVRVGLGGMADNLNGMARGLMDTFTRLADQGLLTRMFQGFNDGFAPLQKIPGQLGQAFVELSIAASPAFQRITEAMAGESDKISQKLTDAFEDGRLEKAIDNGVEIAKRFGRVIADAFGALKNIFGAASAGGGDALSTLGGAFAELRRVTGLPEMQDALARIFGAFSSIASLVTGVVGAALAGLVPIMAPWADAVAGVADLVKGPLMGFFTWIGEHSTLVGSFATGVLAIVLAMKAWALATGAVTLMHGFLTTAVGTLAAAWAASPVGVITLIVLGLAAAFAYAWTESETFRDVVKGVWEGVKDFFAGTWEWIQTYIIDPFQRLYDKLVGNSIIPDLVNAIIGWFQSLWTRTKELFIGLRNWIIDLWNGLWTRVRDRWNSFWNGLKAAISGAWTSFKNSVSGLRTSITNTWNGLWNGARDKVSSIFTTIRGRIGDFASAMRTAFSNLKNALGTIWDGIKSKISAPVKYVVNTVYNNGIRTMWNSIAGKISSKITLPTISLGFNKGGVVPGTGNSDTVPAMLTPGERILSTAQVAQLGGQRGIDAMLGKDKPTKTGGDPSRTEEKRRYQGPTQRFAEGGIVGSVTSAIGGAVSSVKDWAKDVVVGGLKAAAQKAISSMVRPLINSTPGGGVGTLMKDMSNKALDGMLGFLGNEDKKAAGGPAVQKALSWVRTQNGLPYQWGGNGNPSWDCSGLVSAVESVIRGEKPHRRWATGSFVGNSGPAGWVRNLNSPFMIGVTHADVGHTAGTLAGVNVESRGGDGVIVGKGARSYKDSLFTSRWGFAPAAKYDSGGLLQPGATMAINATGRPERVLTPEQNAVFEQLVSGIGAGGSVTIENITVSGSFDFSSPADRRAAAQALVAEMKEAIRLYDKARAR
ncbi:hypothetical protein ABZX40_13610 [Streptomyces sp. NPDC004610]|uniref:hypothetical protein n=1 Tax=unclassified Streptomyces TaxID=2593676 RepID=UPI0033B2BF52